MMFSSYFPAFQVVRYLFGGAIAENRGTPHFPSPHQDLPGCEWNMNHSAAPGNIPKASESSDVSSENTNP